MEDAKLRQLDVKTYNISTLLALCRCAADDMCRTDDAIVLSRYAVSNRNGKVRCCNLL
jgi:hypothetical protein